MNIICPKTKDGETLTIPNNTGQKREFIRSFNGDMKADMNGASLTGSLDILVGAQDNVVNTKCTENGRNRGVNMGLELIFGAGLG